MQGASNHPNSNQNARRISQEEQKYIAAHVEEKKYGLNRNHHIVGKKYKPGRRNGEAEVKHFISMEPACLLNLSETEVDDNDLVQSTDDDNAAADHVKSIIPKPLIPMKKAN